MVEKDIQLLLGKEIRNHPEKYSTMVCELKLEKGLSFRLDRVAKHQIEALQKAYLPNHGLYYKINDMPFIKDNPRMRYTQPKPFDFFFLKHVTAYVIICFYKPNEYKTLYWVHLNDFVELTRVWKKKSIRQTELKEYASHITQV